MVAHRSKPVTEIEARDGRAAAQALLRDHLDAVLGWGEDLCGLTVVLGASVADRATMGALLRQDRRLKSFVTTIRACEMAILARLHQVRACVPATGGADGAVIAAAMRGAVAVLLDVAASLRSNGTLPDADVPDVAGFLRSRALLPEAGIAMVRDLHVGEHMLLCGAVPLGVVMDAVAAALDALDAAGA